MRLRQRLFSPDTSLAWLLLRWLLRGASVPYAWAMWLRNLGYDSGLLKSRAVDIPVLCVGNLSVGGTGKTPMVAWLCGWLRDQGWRVAIVSRGYGQLESGSNDEALELELACPMCRICRIRIVMPRPHWLMKNWTCSSWSWTMAFSTGG